MVLLERTTQAFIKQYIEHSVQKLAEPIDPALQNSDYNYLLNTSTIKLLFQITCCLNHLNSVTSAKHSWMHLHKDLYSELYTIFYRMFNCYVLLFTFDNNTGCINKLSVLGYNVICGMGRAKKMRLLTVFF